jgi:hypothetical protein
MKGQGWKKLGRLPLLSIRKKKKKKKKGQKARKKKARVGKTLAADDAGVELYDGRR